MPDESNVHLVMLSPEKFENALRAAMILFKEHPDAPEGELTRLLIPHTNGDEQEAGMIIDLLPVVFGRKILKKMGGNPTEHYLRRQDDGKISPPQRLDMISQWQPIVDFANRIVSDSSTLEAYQAVVFRDSQSNAANKILTAGHKLADVTMGPVAFLRVIPGWKPRRWWHLWR